jgi:adenylate cyclase
MARRLRLRVVENAQCYEGPLPPLLVVGRQDLLPGSKDVLEDGPIRLLTREGGPPRLVVGWNSETVLGRQQAWLRPLPDGRVRVTNRGNQQPLVVSDLPDPLPPGGEAVLLPPFRLTLGRCTATVFAEPGKGGPRTLTSPTRAPGSVEPAAVGGRSFPRLGLPQFDELVDWLQATVGVLQSAAGRDDFLGGAARALVAVVQLQRGLVALREGGGWKVVASHHADGAGALAAEGNGLSDAVLGEVLGSRRAVWLYPPPGPDGPGAVVAAPLLSPWGDVVGVLYGESRRDAPPTPYDEGKLRAALVEVLASGVAAGLARRESERERALLEQFFPEDLVEQLRREPGLIREARRAQVTVLFCDVRGFSAASKALGPRKTFEWVSAVLSELSECVRGEGGVLVDYIGDELMAMWGAPVEQPDHAARAVRAALAMLRARGQLDRRSRSDFGVPTDVGIGVSSGPAQVGNTGSLHRLKYGPLGDTVNVASRIQGMSKHLKRPLLVSGETWSAVRGSFEGRRVVRVRLVGMPDPCDLYEVAGAGERAEFFRGSEAALEALEERRFPEAARRAGELLEQHPEDGPLQLTLARAGQALVTGGEGFEVVWPAPSK